MIGLNGLITGDEKASFLPPGATRFPSHNDHTRLKYLKYLN